MFKQHKVFKKSKKIVSIVDKEEDWHRIIFLETRHPITDPKAGNERIQISFIYKSLMSLCELCNLQIYANLLTF